MMSIEAKSPPEVSAWDKHPVTTKETRKGTVLAFLAMLFAIYDFILFGTLLPVIQEEFKWSNATATGVNTAVSIGGAIVLLVIGGIVVDRIGRRRGMMLTIGGTALGSALTSIAPGAAGIVAIRSISGLGLAEQGINATYLNEIYALTDDKKIKKNRGFTYSLVQSGFPLGAVLAAAFATVLLPLIGWRFLFLVAAFPAILLVFLRRHLRETPQFQIENQIRKLRKAGQTEEASALATTYGLSSSKLSTPIVAIFQGRALRPTIVLSLAWIANWFGILTFSILGTSVLTLGKDISFSNALLYTVIINLVGFAGYLVHGWAGDRIGRRNVIGIGWLIAGVMFAIMLLWAEGTTAVVVTYAIGMFFLIGPYAALLFYNGESYDTNCRATGVNFLNAMSQVGAITAGLIITGLLASGVTWSITAFYVGAIGVFVSGLIMWFSRHEPELTS
ncbi:MAG TPA: MFS transporter [Terrimesophilobacter sp.]|nr:MFS transporter [Terrimesophilobacter sp.]